MSSLNEKYIRKNLYGKKILIVSLWGWPIFGGGEQFLYDSMKWCHSEGMIVTWICFASADPNAKKNFDKMNTIESPYGCIVQVPGGFDETNLKNWIRLINPDIVHHQGLNRYDIVRVCNELKYPIITGVCFWNDIIELDEKTSNIDIIKNAKLHREHPNFKDIHNWASVVYSASDFVTQAVFEVTGKKLKDVVYSSSLKENALVECTDKFNQKYVTLINCHQKKGGKILLECMKRLPDIPFCAVRTEYQSEKLDGEIMKEMQMRKANGGVQCLWMERKDSIKDVLKYTKILLVGSLVDETFCKTCNEAMCNGIPIVTTGKGNIGFMVGDTAMVVDPKNIDGWVKSIYDLYYDEKLYEQFSMRTKQRYELYSEDVAHRQLISTINKVIFKEEGTEKNVMIFVPWCDQGLGIQARTYVKLFEHIGLTTHIFSYKPYFSTIWNPKFQATPKEWEHKSIYYSKNKREEVTDDEFVSFIKHKSIGHIIIPETCFNRVYEVAELGRKEGCKVYCIPNIEIVRTSEISRYSVFNKIICNNRVCMNYFNKEGYTNTPLVFYTPIDKNLRYFRKQCDDMLNGNIKFLGLGGLNAIVRKQVMKICEGFKIAKRTVNNIELTVCIQGSQIPPEIEIYNSEPGITIIIEHMEYHEIINKYYEHHVNVQVSKHEGLGLGFYESLASGTPVITLDTAPHNEIIENNVNGWTIPCEYENMKDNPESPLKSALFNPNDLAAKMIELASNPRIVVDMCSRIKKHYDENYSLEIIANNFRNVFDI